MSNPVSAKYDTTTRSKWGEGEWTDEPDVASWVDDATGYRCFAVRNPSMGHLCGYVAIPASHPLATKDYSALPGEISAHGGLTFAASGKTFLTPLYRHLSEPFPSEPKRDDWLFGFDCAHCGDLTPGLMRYGINTTKFGDTYKTIAYVEGECRELAAALKTTHHPLRDPQATGG